MNDHDELLDALASIDPAAGEMDPEPDVNPVLDRIRHRRRRQHRRQRVAMVGVAAAILLGLLLVVRAGPDPTVVTPVPPTSVTVADQSPVTPTVVDGVESSTTTVADSTSTVDTTSTPDEGVAAEPAVGIDCAADLPTVIDFDLPAPPGPPWEREVAPDAGALDGVWEGIDFGDGLWRWTAHTGEGESNQIVFADDEQAAASIKLGECQRRLVKITVTSEVEGLLTMTDDAGQTKRQPLTPGRHIVSNTSWANPSEEILIEFTAGGRVLHVDEIIVEFSGEP